MADPVSLVAAGVGISDVAFRVVHYLKDVNAAAKTVNSDIAALISEVDALKSVHGALEQELLRAFRNMRMSPEEKMLWFQTGKNLQQGQLLVRELEQCVKSIYAKSRTVTGRLDGLKKAHRKRSRDKKLTECRGKIAIYHGTLQFCLNFISIQKSREQHETQATMLARVLLSVDALKCQVEQIQISNSPFGYTAAIDRDFASIPVVTTPVSRPQVVEISRAGVNKHFSIPSPVSNLYSGREDKATELRIWLTSSSERIAGGQSKCFILQGMGGTGKTQFTCKFAMDNRDMFWAVMWVDASNTQRLKRSYADQVARIAGVDANERAALHWLKTLQQSWLLIIDNADDVDLDIAPYIPHNSRGTVLITTRNPAFRSLGNVGPGHFELASLAHEESLCLLFQAAETKPSLRMHQRELALAICEKLGHLPLTIVQAGATVRHGFCSLEKYLDYLEHQWVRTSKARGMRRVGGIVAGHSTIYATFELNHRAIQIRETEASSDAAQLLKMLAFFHHQNIRFEFFRRAVTNVGLEEEHAKMVDIIRNAHEDQDFDADRTLAALQTLVQFSLLSYDEPQDSYYMHPLIHRWSRERYSMTPAEQGIWSEAAATMLSHCILLPPLGNTTEDEDIRRDILPHIDFVRQCQATIEQRIHDNRLGRMKPWPVFSPDGLNSKEKALNYAKFSIVYAQNGRWEDARKLQTAVHEFLLKTVGIGQEITRRNINEAIALQKQVLDACISSLGHAYCETFIGRYAHALELQEEAVDGLKYLLGGHNEDTLNAIDHMGRTILVTGTHRAVNGMKKALGPDHLRTLIACENLCMVAMIDEVRRVREEKLGKEHAFTLLAILHLAVVKSGLGDHTGAEKLVRMGLPIAERNFGPYHIASLWGRCALGKICMRQNKWAEAEETLEDGLERHHPSRVSALADLAAAYNTLALVGYDRISPSGEHMDAGKLRTNHIVWMEERKTRSRVTSQTGQ
ncbi:hypothetical protein EK21DRAFT_98630 [Setomelanomma holmii]|uniref:NB-ARC domain-containing protein n=1 Tax=Setomelanomma holmii TaxID=210430 RepID=A0A9P4HEI7_9PLEO|nr:hypothetical protein EK21DRAFT_98630 [Setomelanomma holmii]